MNNIKRFFGCFFLIKYNKVLKSKIFINNIFLCEMHFIIYYK